MCFSVFATVSGQNSQRRKVRSIPFSSCFQKSNFLGPQFCSGAESLGCTKLWKTGWKEWYWRHAEQTKSTLKHQSKLTWNFIFAPQVAKPGLYNGRVPGSSPAKTFFLLFNFRHKSCISTGRHSSHKFCLKILQTQAALPKKRCNHVQTPNKPRQSEPTLKAQ